MGLFTVLLVISFGARGSSLVEATAADVPVMLTYAIISLAIGVAITVAHNVWSGGLLPVVATLVGWLILLKGLVLMVLSPETFAQVVGGAGYANHYYTYLTPSLAIGLYLTWAGFRTKMR
jgi:hypothetical protein